MLMGGDISAFLSNTNIENLSIGMLLMVISTQSTTLQDKDLSKFLIWLERGKEKWE